MAMPSVLRDFNVFVEAKGFAGKADEINLPKLTLKMEEYRGGGMDAPVEIDMGMEKLEADFTLAEFDADVLSLFGVEAGAAAAFRAMGSIFNPVDGTSTAVAVVLRGRIKELDMGAWKGGEAAKLKVTVACNYYKYTQGGVDLIEIDVGGMKRIIAGIDQLAKTRADLGVGVK